MSKSSYCKSCPPAPGDRPALFRPGIRVLPRNHHMTKGHAPERLPDCRANRRQRRIARFFCYTVLVESGKTSYNLRPSFLPEHEDHS